MISLYKSLKGRFFRVKVNPKGSGSRFCKYALAVSGALRTQTFQNPLMKDYSVNHICDPIVCCTVVRLPASRASKHPLRNC